MLTLFTVANTLILSSHLLEITELETLKHNLTKVLLTFLGNQLFLVVWESLILIQCDNGARVVTESDDPVDFLPANKLVMVRYCLQSNEAAY
jgi:hypothetical protein